MIVIIILLSLGLCISMAIMVMMKRDIRLLGKTLRAILKSDTNMCATTETFEKNIRALCGSINDLLDNQKKIIRDSENSNRVQKQAISNLSHDLRTPLTSAIGYVQMVRSDQTPEDKKTEYLDIIEYRLRALSKLINDLYEYTRIVEGKIAPVIEKVNICNTLRDMTSAFYEDLVLKNFTVHIDVPDAPVYILCDSDSIKRVIQNLIQNVLVHGIDKFELSVDLQNHSVKFLNTTLDIGAIAIESLFNRFYTTDLSRSGSSTGLGLTIAAELVNGMGGDIKARAIGDDLEISVSLPFISDTSIL